MSENPDPLKRQLSDAIKIARVVCILGIVYVHAWTGLTGEQLAALSHSGQELLRWTSMEGLGKSAVPLLGMISGYLVAGSARTRDWRAHYATKARTILLPMILWNAIAILLVSGAAKLGWILAPVPQSIGWVAEELFAFTRPPDINVQMPFLRDLFVCMLLAPLLVRLSAPLLAALGMAVVALAITGWPQPVFLRPIILAFFASGMLVRRHDLAIRIGAVPLAAVAIPFLALLPVKIALSLPPASAWSGHWHAMTALDVVTRIVTAVLFWRLAWTLADIRVGTWLRAIEPYAFFLFCCHLILIWLGGPLLGRLTGPEGSPLWPVLFILQPLIVLMPAIALARLLDRIAPAAAGVLSGGRLNRP